MNSKLWLIYWLLFLLFIPIIGLFNYVIDPFQQYRHSDFYKVKYESEYSRYLNSGIIKTYNYDSIALGSSMIANFKLDELGKIIKNPIKLRLSNGTAYEYYNTLSFALNRNKKIETILFGLDFFSFRGETTKINQNIHSFPKYLYDNNIINDLKYLISFDTLNQSIKRLYEKYNNKIDPKFDLNNMYFFDTSTELFPKKHLNIIFDEKLYSLDLLKKSFDLNILTIIKKYPNVKFILFFPPYSIKTFRYLEEVKLLKKIMLFKNYIGQVLLNYKNVQLYDFQNELNIISNDSLYYDFIHYKPIVNFYIINSIKNGDRYIINIK